jgi:DNA-binding transcriptional MocR family regulator
MAQTDLQFNYPILAEQQQQLREHIEAAIAESSKWIEGPPYGGYSEHREAAAKWLSRRGERFHQDTVMIGAGGHNGVMTALLVAGLGGKKIATDRLTYPGFKLQASFLGSPLVPSEMDDDGMLPDSLERAAVEEKVSAVYLMPNVHNPMGTVMSEKRRREICVVAERHGLVIIDDDAYGWCEANPPVNFATLAPERSYFVHSLTKPYAPAMKLAFIVFPDGRAAAMDNALRSLSSGAPALFVDVAARLIHSGEMEKLLEAKRKEAVVRQRIASKAFAGLNMKAHPTSFHVWIELPESRSAGDVAATLKNEGILVSSGSGYAARADVRSNGMRVALGAVRDLETLQTALRRVREVIDSSM